MLVQAERDQTTKNVLAPKYGVNLIHFLSNKSYEIRTIWGTSSLTHIM